MGFGENGGLFPHPIPMNSIHLNPPRILRTACLGALQLVAAVSVLAQSPTYLFTHLAGPLGGPGNIDGSAVDARFFSPEDLAVDAAGNVYVADEDNHSIRKITPSGVVSTLRASDGTPVLFSHPVGVAVDTTGNIFVSDPTLQTIFQISPAGVRSVLAGANYQPLYVGNVQIGDGRDGTGTDARFYLPSGLATDSSGNLYVADSGNHTIRKITPAGVVTTLAGTANQSGGTDGLGAAARFTRPQSVAVDGAGNVYVGDAMATIRKVTPGGSVTTLAGTFGQWGSSDGTGGAARFFRPRVTVDAAGNVFVSDYENHTIRLVTPTGVVTTFAGVAGQKGSADGTGAAARFNYPTGLAVDGSGNVYVGDSLNFTIRKITSAAAVSTFAAVVGGFGATDATGAAARFRFPQGAAVDGNGNVFVADFENHAIRKITPAGVVTTFAGLLGASSSSAVNGTGSAARFYYPSGVALDSLGNLYVAEAGTNSIRKITPDAVVTTFAGPTGSYIFGHADGAAADARFSYPEGIAVDAAGTVYVADSDNSIIRKITPDGTVSTLAGTAKVEGSADGTGAAAQFKGPIALAVDGSGTVFVADTENHTIRKITAGGVVTTFAGVAGQAGSVDGIGAAARFNNPCGLAVDRLGNLFVGDSNNLTIRRITPDGTVSTIGGTAPIIGSADGFGAAANFYFPSGIAVDNAGALYVADEFNHAIRKGQVSGPPVIILQPSSLTVAAGASVQLSVTASGATPLAYQWYFNASPFNGATTQTLSFTNARSSDAGDYIVVVTNAMGSVTSQKATLTVTTAPVAPPSTASGGSSGGGAMESWFGLGLLTLGAARAVARRPRSRHSIILPSA